MAKKTTKKTTAVKESTKPVKETIEDNVNEEAIEPVQVHDDELSETEPIVAEEQADGDANESQTEADEIGDEETIEEGETPDMDSETEDDEDKTVPTPNEVAKAKVVEEKKPEADTRKKVSGDKKESEQAQPTRNKINYDPLSYSWNGVEIDY